MATPIKINPDLVPPYVMDELGRAALGLYKDLMASPESRAELIARKNARLERAKKGA